MSALSKCEWNTGILPVAPADMLSVVPDSAGRKPAGRTDCKLQVYKSVFRRQLFPAQRDDDFLVAAGEDDAAIFDRFDGQLIGLVTELEAENLAFLHRLTVDDSEAGALIERDRGDNEGRGKNVGASVLGGIGLGACDRFPTDRPKRVAAARVY